jgi:hypothetical protein
MEDEESEVDVNYVYKLKEYLQVEQLLKMFNQFRKNYLDKAKE